MAKKQTTFPSCTTGEFKHDYSATRTVTEDAFGTKKRRQAYCTFCGQDRPRRQPKGGEQNG